MRKLFVFAILMMVLCLGISAGGSRESDGPAVLRWHSANGEEDPRTQNAISAQYSQKNH